MFSVPGNANRSATVLPRAVLLVKRFPFVSGPTAIPRPLLLEASLRVTTLSLLPAVRPIPPPGKQDGKAPFKLATFPVSV
jgi:hypothetical protein